MGRIWILGATAMRSIYSLTKLTIRLSSLISWITIKRCFLDRPQQGSILWWLCICPGPIGGSCAKCSMSMESKANRFCHPHFPTSRLSNWTRIRPKSKLKSWRPEILWLMKSVSACCDLMSASLSSTQFTSASSSSTTLNLCWLTQTVSKKGCSCSFGMELSQFWTSPTLCFSKDFRNNMTRTLCWGKTRTSTLSRCRNCIGGRSSLTQYSFTWICSWSLSSPGSRGKYHTCPRSLLWLQSTSSTSSSPTFWHLQWCQLSCGKFGVILCPISGTHSWLWCIRPLCLTWKQCI